MREMLLSELIANYSPLYPEPYTWESTVNYLYEHESLLMEELRESCLTYGWREPVLLSRAQDIWEDQSPCVLNGTHRVALALQNGVFSIPVTTRDELDYTDDDFIVLHIESSEELTEEQDELLVDRLRSWKLNEDVWLTSSCSWGSLGRWTIQLDYSDSSQTSAIEKAARKQLKTLFPAIKFTVRASVELFEDE